jgi:signal transduction histidine kinase
VLRKVLDDLDLLITETKAQITYNTSLPTIEAVPLQISQLFYNLLVNALKFTKHATAPLIHISSRIVTPEGLTFENADPMAPYIEIQITDEGIGFDQQFGEQIFELFERLHVEEDFQGTGMGLALCKKIVENHHGRISALSKEGEGATFNVVLPLKQGKG